MQRPQHVSLNDRVAHWLPCVLEVVCPCRLDDEPQLVPLVRIASAPGGGHSRVTLGSVLAALRCSRCQQRPVRIALREAVVGPGAKTLELGWSFPLPVPNPAPPSGKYNRVWRRLPAGVEYWLLPSETGPPPESGLEDFPDI